MKITLQNLTKTFPSRNKKVGGEVTAVNDFRTAFAAAQQLAPCCAKYACIFKQIGLVHCFCIPFNAYLWQLQVCGI